MHPPARVPNAHRVVFSRPPVEPTTGAASALRLGLGCVAAASFALAAACSPAQAPDAVPPPANGAGEAGLASAGGDRTVYRCGDGYAFTAIPHERGVTLLLPERTVELGPEPAGSDARYAGEGIVFWTRGDESRLETPQGPRTGCTGRSADRPWEAARLLGVDYRAVGQEPGWVVEIEEGAAIRFETDYGQTHATFPAPAAHVDGPRTTYRARTEAHAIVVQVDRTPCADVMSGEPYPTTATVWLDGREHPGCGRELGPGAGQLRGSVVYRERIALPPHAVVIVRLVDLAGGEPRVPLAETRFVSDGQQIPLAFTLDYRSADLPAGARPALEARIETDGRSIFATPSPVPVALSGAAAPVELLLHRAPG